MERETEIKFQEITKRIGIRQFSKTYIYLKDCMDLIINDSLEVKYLKLKDIYNGVSEKTGTNADSIVRSIIRAIKSCDEQKLKDIIGETDITPCQFIYGIAMRICIELKK